MGLASLHDSMYNNYIYYTDRYTSAHISYCNSIFHTHLMMFVVVSCYTCGKLQWIQWRSVLMRSHGEKAETPPTSTIYKLFMALSLLREFFYCDGKGIQKEQLDTKKFEVRRFLYGQMLIVSIIKL